ncbi:hypothetical protein GCM10010249_38210 [Streptomyces roseolilacinus]|uniref:Uncharacterized protein n=1 Tax=Streptomyces roseolilacinus TaxID=66904 RepID=A0A918EME0_9ACTN|nr:hypothetical protein GCM10010249_38210 [Streptomyces roseolilacinus]
MAAGGVGPARTGVAPGPFAAAGAPHGTGSAAVPVRGVRDGPRLAGARNARNAPSWGREGSDPMSKRGNKRRARRGKKANHGKRPNT